MGNPVNDILKTADDVINFAAFKVTVPLTEKAIKTYLTWLNWPVLSQLFDFVFNYLFTKYAYTPGIDYTNAVIIRLEKETQRTAYQNSEGALRAAMISGDQNAIKAASDSFDSTLSKLIHFDGYAS